MIHSVKNKDRDKYRKCMKYRVIQQSQSILIVLIGQLLQILRDIGYNDSARPIHKLVGFTVRM